MSVLGNKRLVFEYVRVVGVMGGYLRFKVSDRVWSLLCLDYFVVEIMLMLCWYCGKKIGVE